MNDNNVPLSQEIEAYKLQADGIRELFKLQLKDEGNNVLYMTPQNSIRWADIDWEEWTCKLTGYAQNSSGEKSRPKFTVANPGGVFSVFIDQGATDGAILTHYEVLASDIESDARIYTKRMWIINKPLMLNKGMVTFECRSTFDGHNFKIPARSFFPPDFPHVTLR